MAQHPLTHRTRTKDPSLSNAAFANRAWKNQPLLMDYLDRRSPLRLRRILQREIYLRAFSPHFGRLRRRTRVLDVGCGIGRFLLPLVSRGCQVVGIDFEPGHLTAARQHLRRVRMGLPPLARSRAERLPFKDGSFDAALAIETLSYTSSPSNALDEIRRVLRPKGLLFLSVETRIGGALSDPHLSLERIEPVLRAGICHIPGSFFARYYHEAEIHRLIRESGFRILETKPAHFILDGILDPLVTDLHLRESTYRNRILHLEHTLASVPSLRPLARGWTIIAQTG